MSEDALYSVLGEGVGKRKAVGKKMKVVLLVKKSESEEHSSDNNFVSGILHQTTIPISLSNEGKGDGGRQKDVVAAKKSQTKAHWRDKLVPTDNKIRAKEDPKAHKSIGTKEEFGAFFKRKEQCSTKGNLYHTFLYFLVYPSHIVLITYSKLMDN